MNGYFNLADWLVIVVYLGGIVGLGMWFGKDQRTTRDYFLGSRNIPWWGIGVSIVAAETSALTIIGVPAYAFAKDGNILFIQMIVGYVIARVILAVVMVPHYMKGEIYSPYQLLEQHLGVGPRRLAAAFFLFLETMAAGVRVYVACIPIRLMLGTAVCSLGGLVDPILGAILGSLIVALFWRRLGARATMLGMTASFVVMNLIYWPAKIPSVTAWWIRTFGGEVFWPWFTLIGTVVTLGVAWVAGTLWPERSAARPSSPVT